MSTFRSRPVEDEPKLDTTPVEMPIGFSAPTPLADMIARMVREAVAKEEGDEFESMDEANDFELDDIDDELLDFSPYELHDLEPEFEDPPAEPAQTPSEAPQETITPPEDPKGPEQVE
jgi:hypothetical protein